MDLDDDDPIIAEVWAVVSRTKPPKLTIHC